MGTERDRTGELAAHLTAMSSGSKLSDSEARELESLASISEDITVRLKRLGYLLSRRKLSKRRRDESLDLLTWLVHTHPGIELHQQLQFKDRYLENEFKKLWLSQATAFPQDAQMLDNLAAFTVMDDSLGAEKLWRAACTLEPHSHRWPSALAHLYRTQAKFGPPEERPAAIRKAVSAMNRALQLHERGHENCCTAEYTEMYVNEIVALARECGFEKDASELIDMLNRLSN